MNPSSSNSPAHLVIDSWFVEGNIDGIGGGVMVWPKEGLLIRLVADHELHEGLWGLARSKLERGVLSREGSGARNAYSLYFILHSFKE